MAINDLQNTTQKTKDRVIRNPLKTIGELMCFRRVSSFCSTCGFCHVALVANVVISHEWYQDWTMITKNGTKQWSFGTHIYRKKFKVMTSP
jgi:hypothetical protein